MDNNIKQDAFVQGLELFASQYELDLRKLADGSTTEYTSEEIRRAVIAGGKYLAQQIYNAIKVISKQN